MPVDEAPGPFSANTNEPHEAGVLTRVRHALLAPPRFDAFPRDTTTAAPIGDVDHGPMGDASARTPEPRPQMPPAPTRANLEAAEPQLARLLLDALAAMRDLGTQLAPAPVGPGVHTNIKGVAARDPIRVAAQTSPVLVLPKNSGRRGLIIFSEPSSSVLYLGYGNGTSLTTLNYVAQIVAGQLYSALQSPCYGGEISLLWAGTTGNALVTELT